MWRRQCSHSTNACARPCRRRQARRMRGKNEESKTKARARRGRTRMAQSLCLSLAHIERQRSDGCARLSHCLFVLKGLWRPCVRSTHNTKGWRRSLWQTTRKRPAAAARRVAARLRAAVAVPAEAPAEAPAVRPEAAVAAAHPVVAVARRVAAVAPAAAAVRPAVRAAADRAAAEAQAVEAAAALAAGHLRAAALRAAADRAVRPVAVRAAAAAAAALRPAVRPAAAAVRGNSSSPRTYSASNGLNLTRGTSVGRQFRPPAHTFLSAALRRAFQMFPPSLRSSEFKQPCPTSLRKMTYRVVSGRLYFHPKSRPARTPARFPS